MAKYVMSDLHGCYDKFIKMIELIKFNENDELYILGDIFDRNTKPLEIYDYIISNKNITLLKGNHEKMFEEYFETGDLSLWYYNGGGATLSSINERGQMFQYELYKFVRSLPIIKVVDKFILVHAGLYLPKDVNSLKLEELLELQEEDINLWSRDNIYSNVKYKDYKIICGHTPAQTINNNYKDVKIIHTEGHIYIDCGACFESANGKLACLRLNDMKEFYI